MTVDVTTGAGTYVIQNSDGVQISTFMVNVLAEMPFATSSFGEYATDVITNTVRATADTFKSIQPMVRTETASLSGLSKAFSPGGSIDMSHTSTAGVSGAVAGASVVSMVAATTAEAAHAANSRTETWNAGSASQIGSNAKAIMKISRPYIVYPERYTEFFGLPSNQIGKIGDCTGYFEVEKFVPSFSAPADELAEIAQILAAGVIP